jgi:hypothetical protein
MALDLLTPVSDVHRRDIIVSDTNMVDPDHTDHVKAGEWIGLDENGQAQAAADDMTTSPAPGEGPFYQVFSQKGDSAAQALGKITIILSHDYEAETDMFKTGVTWAIGDELTIEEAADTGMSGTGDDTRVCLQQAATNEIVVGIVTMTPSVTPSSKLRFHRVSPYTKK